MNINPEIIKVLIIFSTTMAGIIIRNVWDENVNLSKSKMFTGAVLLTVLFYFGDNKYIKMDNTSIMIPTILQGIYCKSIMIKIFKKEKVWNIEE